MDTLKRSRPAEGSDAQALSDEDEDQYALLVFKTMLLLSKADDFSLRIFCRYEEYVPVKKRRAIEQQQRLERRKKVGIGT